MKILYNTIASDDLLNLRKLAGFIGIETELCDTRDRGAIESALQAAALAREKAVVLDVASLKDSWKEAPRLATLLEKYSLSVLLLTTAADDHSIRFLRGATNGAILDAECHENATRSSFPSKSNRLTKELASQSYCRKPGPAIRLAIDTSKRIEVCMAIDEVPAFVQIELGKVNVFVWGTVRVFDVSRPLVAEKEFEDSIDEYIPAIIFLRQSFGEQCWHNPHAGAGMVIDDPLLEKRYGFIQFPELLNSARTHGYHVTLAFIPWNEWRSRSKCVAFFINHSDCFSLCFHGCDHTRDEFRSHSYSELLARSFIARERMNRHHERTGLGVEPLMVCPQEQYSMEGLNAMADSRQFLAVLSTACMPRDLTSPVICGEDLLLPAQDALFGLPVFKRHYSGDISPFAMGLFLGKPSILVEHHQFFKDGPAAVESFVFSLAKLRPGIRWISLAETVQRTHLRRVMDEGQYEVRFFTDCFKLDHHGPRPIEYRLFRRIPPATSVRRLTVNGVETPFTRKDALLHLQIKAEKSGAFQVQLEIDPVKPRDGYSTGLKYQASVAFRRTVSEFRDKVIARHSVALRASQRLAKALKQTSGR